MFSFLDTLKKVFLGKNYQAPDSNILGQKTIDLIRQNEPRVIQAIEAQPQQNQDVIYQQAYPQTEQEPSKFSEILRDAGKTLNTVNTHVLRSSDRAWEDIISPLERFKMDTLKTFSDAQKTTEKIANTANFLQTDAITNKSNEFWDDRGLTDNEIVRFGANLPAVALEETINAPGRFVRGISQIGTQIGGGVRGEQVDPQRLLSGVGGVVEGGVDIGTSGLTFLFKNLLKIGAKEGVEQLAKQGVKEVVKSGAKEGAKFGAIQGVASGLRTGEGLELSDQLKNAALGGGYGLALGTALGGGTPLAREAIGKLVKVGGKTIKVTAENLNDPAVKAAIVGNKGAADFSAEIGESLYKSAQDHTLDPKLTEKYGEFGVKVGELLNELENIGRVKNPTRGLEKRVIEIKNLLPDEFKAQADIVYEGLPKIDRTKLTGKQLSTPNAKLLDGELLNDPKTGRVIGKDEFGALRDAQKSSSQSYVPTEKTLGKIGARKKALEVANARRDFDEYQKQLFKQVGAKSRTPAGAARDIAKSIKSGTVGVAAKDVTELKDIGAGRRGAMDIYRNAKHVYGDKYETNFKPMLDTWDKQKVEAVRVFETLIKDAKKNIVDDLGIKPKSKDDYLVVEFGEGRLSKSSLIEQVGNERANKIIKADNFFRQKYNQFIDDINNVRKRIYPNQEDKIIPKRKDYYRHGKEMTQGLGALINIFDSPANIDPSLASISAITRQKSKWQSIFQRRSGDANQLSAISGYVNYLAAYTHATKIDPEVAKFRNYQSDLINKAEIAVGQGKGVDNRLNNWIGFIDDWINDVSGNTNPVDRLIQERIPGGRKALRVIDWVNSRVKANVILGNLSSSIAQWFNLPQGFGSAKQHSVRGFSDTLRGIASKKNDLTAKSDFIKERFTNPAAELDMGILANAKKTAVWVTQVGDEIATKIIWNSHYRKALAENIPNPVKYADDITRSMIGGRGIGEVPIVQKSRVAQLIMPFQYEMTNAWYVMGDFVSKKDFSALATMFLASYVMNQGAKAIRGSDVVFDPINAIMDAYDTFKEEGDAKVGGIRASGRLAGEVLSNLPFGQSIAQIYPEFGMDIFDERITREELFGDADPTRYGSGLLLTRGLQDPLFKIVPPYGGQQIERSIQGLNAFKQGYSATDKGSVRFPIKNNAENLLRTSAFGQYGTPEARRYFDEDLSVLGKNQSEIFRNLQGSDREDYYNSVIDERKAKTMTEAGIEQETRPSFFDRLFNTKTTEASTDMTGDGVIDDVAIEKGKIQFKNEDSTAKLLGDNILYKEADGDVKTLKLTDIMTKDLSGDTLSSLKNIDDATSAAKKLVGLTNLFDESSEISEDQARSIVENMGLNYDEVLWGEIGDMKNDTEIQYIHKYLSRFEGEERDAEVDKLLNLGVFTDDKLKKMYAAGYLNETTYNSLKTRNSVLKYGSKSSGSSRSKVQPQNLSLTGNKYYDKQVVEEYNKVINKEINEIIKAASNGQISQEDATRRIQALEEKKQEYKDYLKGFEPISSSKLSGLKTASKSAPVDYTFKRKIYQPTTEAPKINLKSAAKVVDFGFDIKRSSLKNPFL